MEKLTAEQVAKLELKARPPKTSRVEAEYKEMANLRIGESLLIKRNEWPLKTAPYAANMPRRYKLPYAEYQHHTLADNSGWVITRTA